MSQYGAMLPALYSFDQTNGWSKGMRAVTHALLSQVEISPGPILEVGCGAGVFCAELTATVPDHTVVGVDMHPLALAFAKNSAGSASKLARSDLQQLPFAATTFSALIALDTFDQAGVDIAHALRESWRVLRDRGMLILRVSAYPWLEGNHDEAFNTGRRFTASEIESFLHTHGFDLLRMTYANTLLAPPIMLLRLLERWGWARLNVANRVDSRLNTLLEQILKWEADWLQLHNFAYGISLYAVARKQR